MGGVRFGKYRIVSRIARGGMAEISLATSHGPEGFAKTVAIKRLLPHLAERPDIVSMLLDEARIAAGLHHPHIVQIFDLGREGDDHYICMEYLAGKDLAAIIARAHDLGVRLPIDAVVQILSCVAQGLHFAHEHRAPDGSRHVVVHGDISPSNVMVTFVGEVKIVDFGIARTVGAVEQVFPGVIKGKLSYLPPEQLLDGHMDRRGDIFALGVVAHELLTGERLFKRDDEQLTIKALLEDPIPDPREKRPEIPDRLAAVIMQALERDTGRRLQTAEQMRLGLDACLAAGHYLPTSTRLAEFLAELFGPEEARSALCPPRTEPTGSVTNAEEPAAPVPLPDFGVDAVPLMTESRARGNQLVRVVGEVPAALFKAGQNLVAVPASVLGSMRSHRRRVIVLAIAFALGGFGIGLLLRDLRDAVGPAAAANPAAPPTVGTASTEPVTGGEAQASASPESLISIDPANSIPPEPASTPLPASMAMTPGASGPEVDEASPPTRPDAKAHAPTREYRSRPHARAGRLVLSGKGEVYVRGTRLGTAPLSRSLPAGTYDVALVEESGAVRGPWFAVVRPGKTTRLALTP